MAGMLGVGEMAMSAAPGEERFNRIAAGMKLRDILSMGPGRTALCCHKSTQY